MSISTEAPSADSPQDSIQVVCRVRPQNSRETAARSKDVVTVSPDGGIAISALGKQFSFDTVLGPESSQVCYVKSIVAWAPPARRSVYGDEAREVPFCLPELAHLLNQLVQLFIRFMTLICI